jgi:hypothetical protein
LQGWAINVLHWVLSRNPWGPRGQLRGPAPGHSVSQSAKNEDPGCQRILAKLCHSCQTAGPSSLHRTTQGQHKEAGR